MSDDIIEQDAHDRRVRTIAKGGGIDIVGRLGSEIIGAISAPITSRLLGDASYGRYVLAREVVLMLSMVLRLGYPPAILRYVGVFDGEGRTDRARAVVAGTCLTSIAIATLAAVVLVLRPELVSVAIYDKPLMAPVLRIIVLTLPAHAVFFLMAQAAIARGNAVYRAAGSLAGRVFLLAGVIVLCGALGFKGAGAAYAFLFGYSVAAVMALVGVVRLFGRITTGDLTRYDFREINLFALPLLLGQLSQYGLFRVNALIGGRWLTESEVGFYGAASQIAFLGIFGLDALGIVFAPIMADLHNRGRMESLREMFSTTTRWAYYFTLPIMLIAIFKASSVLRVFGPDFAAAASVLQLLCVGQLVSMSVGAAGNMLAMSGYHWLAAVDNFMMAGSNVLLCLLLTQRQGMMGLALAATLATAGVNLLRAAQVWWLHRISAYTFAAVRPVLVSIPLLPLLLIRFEPWWLDLLLPAVLFLGAFVLALRLVGLHRDDRQVLRLVRARLLRKFASPSAPASGG